LPGPLEAGQAITGRARQTGGQPWRRGKWAGRRGSKKTKNMVTVEIHIVDGKELE